MRYEHALTLGLTVSQNPTGSSDTEPTVFTLQKYSVYKTVSACKTITYIITTDGYPQSDMAYNDDDVLIF